MKRLEVAVVLSFLPYLALAQSVCEDDTSCSAICYPVTWERNLCLFYSQLSSWRATAEGCGLTLPAPPTRDRSRPGDEQWLEAREYWELVTELWRQNAAEAGVFGDSALSGSGAPTSAPPDPSQSSWTLHMVSWEQDYSQWNTFVQRAQSGSQDIVQGLSEEETADSVRANSQSWSDLSQDWGDAVMEYNNSYAGRCSSA